MQCRLRALVEWRNATTFSEEHSASRTAPELFRHPTVPEFFLSHGVMCEAGFFLFSSTFQRQGVGLLRSCRLRAGRGYAPSTRNRPAVWLRLDASVIQSLFCYASTMFYLLLKSVARCVPELQQCGSTRTTSTPVFSFNGKYEWHTAA